MKGKLHGRITSNDDGGTAYLLPLTGFGHESPEIEGHYSVDCWYGWAPKGNPRDSFGQLKIGIMNFPRDEKRRVG